MRILNFQLQVASVARIPLVGRAKSSEAPHCAAGASYAGNWIDKIVFARPRWKRGQMIFVTGSSRSYSFFTTA